MRGWKGFLASVEVGVALLGYGTVGASVSRLLAESGEEIERATGHRLRVVRALVRDLDSRSQCSGVPNCGQAAGKAADARRIYSHLKDSRTDRSEAYVRELLCAGNPVVSANKQLVAREGAELFAAASEAGVQLRFEASVCAAIPVVKVLRESLIATNVHRVLGIVNGTTNFILSRMERGETYDDSVAVMEELLFRGILFQRWAYKWGVPSRPTRWRRGGSPS